MARTRVGRSNVNRFLNKKINHFYSEATKLIKILMSDLRSFNTFTTVIYSKINMTLEIVFQIKLKIQNDKSFLFPDPFMMDWDSLSETELKRLVSQLEKTRNDVALDYREAQLRLVRLSLPRCLDLSILNQLANEGVH